MALSSYVMLLHVGYIDSAHSLYLQVWLEQGILGLLALLALLVMALRYADRRALWHVAALASFAVILVHGIFEIPLYGGRGIQLLFVPLALLARPTGLPPLPQRTKRRPIARPGGIALAVLSLLALLVLLLPAPRAAFLANLGAVQLNKGYGVAVHLEALRRLGPCPLHRLTFRGVLPPDAAQMRLPGL